jgi:hypothetical protein
MMIAVKVYALLDALETDPIQCLPLLRFCACIIVLGTLISIVIELAHL